ncbi:MAG: formyltetrahydrofolate deformylase [Candidatus Omnitrophica bacterium]|nr:formyltetrahydrofolate deformylase [Candidatus Omnitrophota bacterium]
MSNRAILLISCPDQKGITAAVTELVFRHGGNILHAAQHTDAQAGAFFMRIEWDMDGFTVPRQGVGEVFRPLAERFKMNWRLHFSDEKIRLAIFVSRHLHCLYDLWFRYQAGQLPNAEIKLVVSNHLDVEPLARQWGLDFLHTPLTPETKAQEEGRQLAALSAAQVDLVILARYHQILSSDFLRNYPDRVINIHHSFLPAFVGGSPYAQAYEKGVKIIGATSHYVIEALDQGPIIEQDTARIDHRYSVADMIDEGQDLERMVLYRAVRWHLEHKILCYGNKTVIFD